MRSTTTKGRRLTAAALSLLLFLQCVTIAHGAEDPYAHVRASDLEAARIQLEAMGQPDLNGAGLALNYATFVIYRVAVYGDPYGDRKADQDDVLQYRYLGYDLAGRTISNDLFPPDADSGTPLVDKHWIATEGNYSTWADVFLYAGAKDYILTAHVLNDGRPTGLSLTDILAGRPVAAWAEKLDYIRIMSIPSVEMNGTVQLRQANGYYDTFTIPAMKSAMRPSVTLRTESAQVRMGTEAVGIELPLDIAAAVHYGALPESCMKILKVRYDGYQAPRGNDTGSAEIAAAAGRFTVEIRREHLQTGMNTVLLKGSAEFRSVFPSDPVPVIKTAALEIAVYVGQDMPPVPEPPPIPEETAEISAEADLILPDMTYEGHPTEARDASAYTVDGEAWSASRAYAEGLGTNRFSVLERDAATIRRIDPVTAMMTFSSPGAYTARLEVRPDGGAASSDQERITVRGTPSVSACLGGVRKEKRKQTLAIDVAVHPAHPLETMRLELVQLRRGEDSSLKEAGDTLVRLEGPGARQSSAVIKTRPLSLITGGDGQLFERYAIDFLTREPGTFRYRVTARDSRGRTCTATADFDVAPDLPPEAAIELAGKHYRAKGTDTALVDVEDGTRMTDGDQVERVWEMIVPDAGLSMAPSADLSFGAKKKVRFEKKGVGPFQIRLSLAERWTEPTLEEFVTDGDRRRAEITAQAEVDNVAPIVSMTPIKAIRARILAFAAGEQAYETLKAGLADREAFIRNGIDAAVSVKALGRPSIGIGESNGPRQIFCVGSPYGYEGRWTFLERNGYEIDEDRLYVLNARWPSTDADGYPEAPYALTAYGTGWQGSPQDGQTREPEWVCTVDRELLAVDRRSKVAMHHDDTGEYLYLVCDGKTLLIDKSTGSALAKLDFAAGAGNYVTEYTIYSIRADGIYAIDRGCGVVRKVMAPLDGCSFLEKTRRVGGKISMIAANSSKLILVRFDPETGRFDTLELKKIVGEIGTAQYGGIGFDAAGNFGLTYRTDVTNGRTGVVLCDRNGRMIRRIEKKTASAGEYLITPILDEMGMLSHVAMSRKRKSSGSYIFEVELHGVADGICRTISQKGQTTYPCSNEAIFARRVGGRIDLAYGAIWDYIYGVGYDYGERALLITADATSGALALSTLKTTGLQATDEYGRMSDSAAAIQSSGNSPTDPSYRTMVISWPQSRWNQILLGIDRFLHAGSDAQFIVVSDPDGILDREDADGRLLAAAETRAADAGAVFLLDRTNESEALREQIISRRSGAAAVLGIGFEKEEATLEKSFALEPGKRYYYEFDFQPEASSGNAGPAMDVELQAAFQIDRALEQGLLETGVLRVCSMETEDFNDKDLNGFFSLGSSDKIRDGVYTACDASSGNSETRRVRTLTDTIRFTVPADRRAIVSFKYDFKSYPTFIKGNGISLDGENWDVDMNVGQGSGRTVFKKFLDPGTHALTSCLAYYGELPESYRLAIDDLAVCLVGQGVEQEEPQDRGSGVIVTGEARAEPAGGSWIHVSGEFQAPSRIMAFRPLALETVREDFDDAELIPSITDMAGDGSRTFRVDDGQYTHPASLSCDGALRFTVPPDRLARALLRTWSRIGRSPVAYEMNGRMWTNGIRESERDEFTYTGSPYDIVLPHLEGDNLLTVRNGYRSETGIDWAELDLFDKNVLTADGRYVIDRENGCIWVESDTACNGGTIRLVLGGASGGKTVGLRDFNMYHIENGIREYVASDYFTISGGDRGWEASGASLAVLEADAEIESAMTDVVYKKGDSILYNILYMDHEKDPSKRQYWRYTHQPFTDGMHPDAGRILDRPIERFEIDGRYTVEHWQEDSTGDPAYDKLSNVAQMTFYIEGGSAAPWIRWIRTMPSSVRAGARYDLLIAVDDHEKDTLSLTTEIFDPAGRMIGTFENGPIIAVDGAYAPVKAGPAPAGPAGNYQAVATVRDQSGAGVGSLRFIIAGAARAEGAVHHTEQWDINRRQYNLSRFGEEENADDPDLGLAPRGRLVFWPGEKILLKAETSDNVRDIRVSLVGYPQWTCALDRSDLDPDSGTAQWTGALWDESFRSRWESSGPHRLTVRFTAAVETAGPDGAPVTTLIQDDVDIILYNNEDFWRLHRVW